MSFFLGKLNQAGCKNSFSGPDFCSEVMFSLFSCLSLFFWPKKICGVVGMGGVDPLFVLLRILILFLSYRLKNLVLNKMWHFCYEICRPLVVFAQYGIFFGDRV